jgi:hypothetical protein
MLYRPSFRGRSHCSVVEEVEDIGSLPDRWILPANGRTKAVTILVIVVFLPLLKRFYAGFYCWKAVDSE